MISRRVLYYVSTRLHGLQQAVTSGSTLFPCLSVSLRKHPVSHLHCTPSLYHEQSVKQDICDNIQSAEEILTNLDEADQLKLQEIKMRYEMMLTKGLRVPDTMTDENWLKLMNTPSKAGKEKLLRVWYSTEKKKRNEAIRGKQKAEERSRLLSENILKPLSFLERIYPRFITSATTLVKDLYSVNAMMINHPMLIDLAYTEDNHTPRERKELARQLSYVFSYNRELIDPYNIVFCNVQPEGNFIKDMEKNFLRSVEKIPIVMTSRNYSDLYPREKLVYLSPDSPNYYNYNPEDIVIIGGIVDLGNNEKLSLRSAKKNNIRHAKLPLDLYIKWVSGSKCFPLNNVFKIMHVVSETYDWEKAFEMTIPKRNFTKLER